VRAAAPPRLRRPHGWWIIARASYHIPWNTPLTTFPNGLFAPTSKPAIDRYPFPKPPLPNPSRVAFDIAGTMSMRHSAGTLEKLKLGSNSPVCPVDRVGRN
jgi:hypothetical protein